MFDIPDAKRIRRADLYSTLSPEPYEPDPALAALLQSQLSRLYGPITDHLTPSLPLEFKLDSNVQAPLHITATDLNASGTQDEGFEFPLFSRATTSLSKDKKKTLTRVRLDDDADPSTHGKGAFITPLRHLGYYFTSLDPDWGRRRRGFEAVALSGEDVKDYLRVRYKGWEVPWRVMTLKTMEMMKLGTRGKRVNGLRDEDIGTDVPQSTAHTEPTAPTHLESFPDLDPTHQTPQKSPNPNPIPIPNPTTSIAIPLSSHSPQLKTKTKPKTKPNKKRRIILRKRKKLEDEALKRKGEEHERMMKREREREEMAREKRVRKNREKKVKRLRKKEEERERERKRGGEGRGEGRGDLKEGLIVDLNGDIGG